MEEHRRKSIEFDLLVEKTSKLKEKLEKEYAKLELKIKELTLQKEKLLE
jgi:hypothetical protein